MVSLYVLRTKIYHFLVKFFQIEQIRNLQQIGSVSDSGPLASADMAKQIFL
jgi:hypothetical protein